MVSFLMIMKLVEFPVQRCPVISHIAGRMKEHSMYRHFRLKVVVLHYFRDPLPRYNMC